jgi:hypothetical protein
MLAARRRPVTALFVLLTLGLLLAVEVLLSAAPAQAATWTASSARPYSAPVWYPLRDTAAVSCNHGSAGCGDYHPYWALDLLGQKGDPVHAAGAGILHVGARDSGCKSSSTPDSPGTWVWIDHGAGIVSRYHHLDGIAVAEGALVTPATVIGTMGSTGDFAPCTTNYLHFEVRTGGVRGARVNPGQLYGCQGASRVSYPSAWGYSSWSQVAKVSRWTPQLGNGCLPASTGTTTAPASVAVARGNASARLTWGAPASGASTVTGYVISQELWAPSVSAWHDPTYRTVSASQRASVVTGLENGRRYRFRVQARNAAGMSAWTRYVEVVPATVPTVPATDRGLSSSFDLVRLAWWKSAAQGTPVISYTAAIRRQTATGWTAWTYRTVPAGTYSYKFTGLRQATTYQVTVRADSDAGSSRYGVFRTVTTTRR